MQCAPCSMHSVHLNKKFCTLFSVLQQWSFMQCTVMSFCTGTGWAGNTHGPGKLESSAGGIHVGWHSSICRGRKLDLATAIQTAYECNSFTLNNYTELCTLALLLQSVLVVQKKMINFIFIFTSLLLLEGKKCLGEIKRRFKMAIQIIGKKYS